jgi:hypothetical protein
VFLRRRAGRQNTTCPVAEIYGPAEATWAQVTVGMFGCHHLVLTGMQHKLAAAAGIRPAVVIRSAHLRQMGELHKWMSYTTHPAGSSGTAKS